MARAADHRKSAWKHPLLLDFARRYGRPSDPVSAAADASELLLQTLGIEAMPSGFTDLKAVARLLGFGPSPFVYRSFEGTARLARGAGGAMTIYLNPAANGHYYRLRYSVAHELAHVLIRRGARPLGPDDREAAARHHAEEEILCQVIASELLLPRDSVRAFMTAKWGGEITLDLVHELVRHFRVSLPAVLNRLAFLIDGARALYWTARSHPRHPDRPPELRIQWAAPLAPVRPDPYIPFLATAKEGRFTPNLPLVCFRHGGAMTDRVKVRDLGGVEGLYDVLAFALSPPSLFDAERNTKPSKEDRGFEFDVATLLLPPKQVAASPPPNEAIETKQLSLAL